jgi:NitT/TauT family transport system ATP-binding protein
MIAATETKTLSQQSVDFRFDDVGHRFPGTDHLAISGVDLTLERGSFTALIGPSGCGKSTLLNMMAGLLQPSRGSVSFRGRSLDEPANEIGMMFQKPALLPWRTTLENILLPVEVSQGRAAARAAVGEAHDLIDTVGLSGFADAYPWQLSGGMAQRAAICRMLITKPEVLLLDEPFGALDEMTRERMDTVVQDIAMERQATVVLVTHSIPESVFLADRILAMAAGPGRVIQAIEVDIDRPRTVESMADPRFVDYLKDVRHALDRGHHE